VKHNEQLAPTCERGACAAGAGAGRLQRHPVFFSAALPKRVLPPMFNRYAGEATTTATMSTRPSATRGGERVRTDLSCTLFLCDPADYDGGELSSTTPSARARVKLPAGHLVLYPGTSVHRVEPVTRGARLASFFWIESLVRSDEQRRLLFDLDMNLMRLRQRIGDCDETVALTGTYHNLLRQWADT
jgi:PKHD-type hydroxylase